MKQSNVEKLMRFVIEHKESITQILKFLNEQESVQKNVADSDKQDPGYSTDETDQKTAESGKDVSDDKSADEDSDNVMNEGEEEKAGTEATSDGNDYPEDGLGGGVEDPSLGNGAQPGKGSCCTESDEVEVEVEVKDGEDEDEEGEEEKLEETGGTASAQAPGGAAAPAAAPQGSSNTGIARVKAPIGKQPKKRYDESISEEEREVLEMIESFKKKDSYRIIEL